MLVLTRHPGESVMVGDDIVITVLDVRGDVVRVGIAAPRSIGVHREEVYRELQRANRDAASPSDVAVEALSRLLRPPAADQPPGDEPAE
ncbi:MAG: carbon storage regulator [Actinobacteria bacterium 13_2_20CM_2_71_6]|nr:MAG: carbon storage regulator [Actinobacteria bacterium 13_2_20CM_2_71_6]TML28056.1 MAG: carbon storage regulator CsrA [Actinomycetota bacterium]